MSLDFQQVYEQVRQMGEVASRRAERLKSLRAQAQNLMKEHAREIDHWRAKVMRVVQMFDPSLRCALPVKEPLDAHFPAPSLPAQATLLAADGSQIAPDRHEAVAYCLINVGAIEMRHGSPQPPKTTVFSHLFYDEQLYTPSGTLTEATLALMRDLQERNRLVELAHHALPPVITFTDGPMELWGAKDKDSEAAAEFQRQLEEYKKILRRLNEMNVITAGYVDKPGANLVVRLLELELIPQSDLPNLRTIHPLRGVMDIDLYRPILGPGERSAVFALQSQSAQNYPDALALHFFYLNVGRPGHPWLSRVEIPAWVAENSEMLNHLHAALTGQCRIMGNRPYPYLLHRAHEAAVVTLEEKEQVTQMIMLELRRRGVEVGERSYKQSIKELAGRTRFEV